MEQTVYVKKDRRVFTIYAIIDPRTGEVCYVGRTSRYQERQEEHKRAKLNPSDRHQTESYRRGKAFLQAMREEGHVPRFRVLEEAIGLDKARYAESKWYRRMKKSGAPLQNGHPESWRY